jgi:hypothetical protein
MREFMQGGLGGFGGPHFTPAQVSARRSIEIAKEEIDNAIELL